MKHMSGLLLAAILSITANAQRLDLRDINSGKYYARGVQSVTSSADGESYFQADKENKMIIKYSYKTGLPRLSY